LKLSDDSEKIFKEIEARIAEKCTHEFGDEFYQNYSTLKKMAVSENIKSATYEGMQISYHAKEILQMFSYDLENTPFDENIYGESEMQSTLTNKINGYISYLNSDNTISNQEKAYLINSLQGQIYMVPTTFSVINLIVELEHATEFKNVLSKRGWLKNIWQKVTKFVGVVIAYGFIGSFGGNIGTIAGVLVGIGMAVYCSNNDYKPCMCKPINCLISEF
jgi:ribosomal protein S17E